MAKATRSSTIAIHDGIAVRLQELGFEKRSIRLYLKETGHVSEWVHFSIDREQNFVDTYGVFDNAMQAHLDCYLGPSENPGIPGLNQPGHIYCTSLTWAKHLAFLGQKAWKNKRRPWRPLEYFRDPPKADVHWMFPYISDNGRWRPDPDPVGCAAASLEAWRLDVEAVRDELLEDRLAIALSLVEDNIGWPEHQVVRRHYVGDLEGARAIADDIIASEGVPPCDAYLKRAVKGYRGTIEQLREANIENTTRSAREMRQLVIKLGI